MKWEHGEMVVVVAQVMGMANINHPQADLYNFNNARN